MGGLVLHGLGGVKDLPVPTWIFYWAGAVVLVVSFVTLGALWHKPLLAKHEQGRPLPRWIGRIVLSTGLRVVLQTASAALLVTVLVAAMIGNTDPFENLAPTWIYVAFWLGVPLLSVLLGDVWRALSPWLAIADAFVWISERLGRTARPLADYPERWGRFPAAMALFAFVALELAYSEPASPRTLAFATSLYTYVTLFGYAAFGREAWQSRGEGFAVAFSYLARLAPFTTKGRRLFVRWPFTGLAGAEKVAGSLAVIAVMLGSVGFDGLSRTSWWQDLLTRTERRFIVDQPLLAEWLVILVNLVGLLAVVAIVALAYSWACRLARSSVNAPRSLRADFLLSLVPIAFVYLVAHYFSLFVIQGQYVIPLLSDPLGRDWDLFDTAAFAPNLAPFSPDTIWYVQAVALVSGHVAGLGVAHDRAIAIFRDRRDVVRSQLPMLALMVFYTVGGLWILSRG